MSAPPAVWSADIPPGDLVHDHALPRRAVLLAAVQHAAVGRVVGRDEAFEHGDVEPRALARARSPPERAQDCPEGVGSREHVGGL